MAIVGKLRAGAPATFTWSPVFSVSRVQPRRINVFGLGSSKFQFSISPLSFFTSMYSRPCGLFHSSFVTVPSTSILARRSNSDCEWCARAAGAEARLTPTSSNNANGRLFMMRGLLRLFGGRGFSATGLFVELHVLL